MGILITIVTVLLVLNCLLLVGIILLQRGRGQGLAGAFGVGGMDEALGTHATSTAQKITVVLAVLFLALSVALSLLYKHRESLLVGQPAGRPAAEAPAGAPAESPSGSPAAPTAERPAPKSPAKGLP